MKKIDRHVTDTVSPWTKKRIVNQSLGLKWYLLGVKQPKTEELKKRRVEAGRRLPGWGQRHDTDIIKIFSDGAWSPRTRKHYKHIKSCIDNVPQVMQNKHPARVMALGVVSREAHVLPPHFFGTPKISVPKFVNLGGRWHPMVDNFPLSLLTFKVNFPLLTDVLT